jgi:hypothetical protein
MKRFNRLARISGNNFIVDWVYTEQIFAHAHSARVQVLTIYYMEIHQLGLSQRETISSLTEQRRKQFHRLLSIQENGSRDGEIFP